MINSATETIEQSLAKIVARLEELGYVPSDAEAQDSAYSDEEEAEIEARLAALGYL
jgi:hypothetical protein